MKYTKTPLTIAQSITLLQKRKLIIENQDRAEKYLNSIGYYRLTGYTFHLQKEDDDFLDGTKFDHIIKLYEFDKKLRAIVLEYLERIEICLRAKLNYKYSLTEGFFWYSMENLYADMEAFKVVNEYIAIDFKDEKEPFIKAFKKKYTSETLPPSNMALERLPLGKLARLYKGLKNENAKIEIANEFNLPSHILSSWLIYLANVRNICAHHSRLWNKKMTADRPILPDREKYKFKGEIKDDTNSTMYGVISIINRLLSAFNNQNNFTEKIEILIAEYCIDVNLMGFPLNWQETANWKKE